MHGEYDRYWFHHGCVSEWIIKGGKFKHKLLISFLNQNVENMLSMSQSSIKGNVVKLDLSKLQMSQDSEILCTDDVEL